MRTASSRVRETAVVTIVTDCMSALGRYRVRGDSITVTWNDSSMSARLTRGAEAEVVARELLRKIVDRELG